MTRAAETEQKVEHAQRRFFGALSLMLTAVLVALVIALLLLVNQVRDGEQTDAANNEAHRRRNEQIHACIVAKEDAFRRDVYALLQTKPGTAPAFPPSDGISCPAINP